MWLVSRITYKEFTSQNKEHPIKKVGKRTENIAIILKKDTISLGTWKDVPHYWVIRKCAIKTTVSFHTPHQDGFQQKRMKITSVGDDEKLEPSHNAGENRWYKRNTWKILGFLKSLTYSKNLES